MRLLCVGGRRAPRALTTPRTCTPSRDQLGIAEQIEWVGEVADPRPWLGRADVAVLPSHKEAMGLVLAEAGAAGLPLVGSRVGGIPEVVRDGTSGITFAPDDPNASGEALLSCRRTRNSGRSWPRTGRSESCGRRFQRQRQADVWRQFLTGAV